VIKVEEEMMMVEDCNMARRENIMYLNRHFLLSSRLYINLDVAS